MARPQSLTIDVPPRELDPEDERIRTELEDFDWGTGQPEQREEPPMTLTTSLFRPATKKQTRARIGLVGPSGSGKTYTALRIALGLGSRIALIDTENRTASKYVGEATPEGTIAFDVMELETFSPETYVLAIEEAGRLGYDVIVIDSLTHAWTGKEGALEQVDRAAARSSGNKWAAWRDVTPMHNKLIDAMVRSPAHVIATMRVKTEWVVEENDRGKKVPRKIGLAPEQRSGMEYEFDIVGDLDHNHKLIVSKSRCSALADGVFTKPGGDVAGIIRVWLSDGTPMATAEQVAQIREAALAIDVTEIQLRAAAEKDYGAPGIESLTKNQAEALIARLRAKERK